MPLAASAPSQWIQLPGAALILLAFVLLQMRRTRADHPVYLGLNCVGATLLAIEATRTEQLGFLALEACWAIVSGFGLWQVLRRTRRGHAPSPSPDDR